VVGFAVMSRECRIRTGFQADGGKPEHRDNDNFVTAVVRNMGPHRRGQRAHCSGGVLSAFPARGHDRRRMTTRSFPRAIRMLSEGFVDVDAIVSGGIELAQYPDGVDRLRAGTT
jgi:hypothetical protein